MSERMVIETVDVHAAGEPGRIITNMGHLVKGDTMAQRFAYATKELNWLRHTVLREPRGYPAMCAAMVMPPVSPEADFGMIVLEQANFTAMSGSNTMCTVTAVLETGIVPMQEPITKVVIDTAVGQIHVTAECKAGKVVSVSIDNVPAWVVELDRIIDVPEYGKIPVDIIFGGQFFAQTDISNVGLEVDPNRGKEITRAGAAIKAAINAELTLTHPENPTLTYVNLVLMHNGDRAPGKQARNATVLTSGEPDLKNTATWAGTLDRSPCGTGTSARMAGLYARGQLSVDEPFSHKSILDTEFIGTIRGETEYFGMPAILPTIKGPAWVTGTAKWTVDPTDPFQNGYRLTDIWAAE